MTHTITNPNPRFPDVKLDTTGYAMPIRNTASIMTAYGQPVNDKGLDVETRMMLNRRYQTPARKEQHPSQTWVQFLIRTNNEEAVQWGEQEAAQASLKADLEALRNA